MVTMRDAVRKYFDDNGFGSDGGYSAKWVDFKVGPIPFPLPNTEARKAAIRYHDLNHVLTGYRTDFAGECEISAWELGAGCGEFVAAWALNLGGLAAGAFFQPRRTWRAFVAGRRSHHAAYAMNYEFALESEVKGVRELLDIKVEGAPRASDVPLFAAAAVAGVALGGLMLVALLSPITLVLWWRGRQASRQPISA